MRNILSFTDNPAPKGRCAIGNVDMEAVLWSMWASHPDPYRFVRSIMRADGTWAQRALPAALASGSVTVRGEEVTAKDTETGSSDLKKKEAASLFVQWSRVTDHASVRKHFVKRVMDYGGEDVSLAYGVSSAVELVCAYTVASGDMGWGEGDLLAEALRCRSSVVRRWVTPGKRYQRDSAEQNPKKVLLKFLERWLNLPRPPSHWGADSEL
jgi:hypothetical protein